VAVSPISHGIIKTQSPFGAVSPISHGIIKTQSPFGAVSPISCSPVLRVRTMPLRTDQLHSAILALSVYMGPSLT
jgi:hypothetical protein